MKTKQSYLFSKNPPKGADRGTWSTAEQYPYTLGTSQQPIMASNIKRQTKTYSRGNVPADHQKTVFSKSSLPSRREQHKMESEMRLARNKKFSDNKQKAIEQASLQQYNFA